MTYFLKFADDWQQKQDSQYLLQSMDWIVSHTHICPVGLKWGSLALKDKTNEQIRLIWYTVSNWMYHQLSIYSSFGM